MKRRCPHCKKWHQPKVGAANRADKLGAPIYCSRVCSGLARRKNIAPEAKKAAKSEYDKARRQQIGEELRAKKREAYYANHEKNLAYQAELRKKPGAYEKHLAYLRNPEYREKKKSYDAERQEAGYADFAESWRLLQALEKEIRSRQSAYERRKARGYYARASINRRREAWKLKNSTPVTLKLPCGIP